jgi:hypothetical protein
MQCQQRLRVRTSIIVHYNPLATIIVISNHTQPLINGMVHFFLRRTRWNTSAVVEGRDKWR